MNTKIVKSVTAVVPHYNRPDMLRDAVLSIAQQTVRPDQILIVDDCSTPENQEKIESLSSLATIVRTPQNIGLAGARNFGAQRASGEWLAFLDDDDTWLPDKQERQIRYLEAHPEVQALGGGTTMRTPEGKEEYWGEKPTYRVNLAHALAHTASLIQSLMIRRDVLLELGGFNTSLRYLEDYEFGIRLLAEGYETHFLGEPLFIYHHGGREQISLHHSRMLKSEVRILNMHSDLSRRVFGTFGPLRLKARCYMKYGLRMGGVRGRSLWACGGVMEAMFGRKLAGISQ